MSRNQMDISAENSAWSDFYSLWYFHLHAKETAVALALCLVMLSFYRLDR